MSDFDNAVNAAANLLNEHSSAKSKADRTSAERLIAHVRTWYDGVDERISKGLDIAPQGEPPAKLSASGEYRYDLAVPFETCDLVISTGVSIVADEIGSPSIGVVAPIHMPPNSYSSVDYGRVKNHWLFVGIRRKARGALTPQQMSVVAAAELKPEIITYQLEGFSPNFHSSQVANARRNLLARMKPS